MADLFLEGDECRRLDARIGQRIDVALAKATAEPMVSQFRAAEFCPELALFDFSNPKDIDEVVDWVLAELPSAPFTARPRREGVDNPHRPSWPRQLL